MRAALWLIGLFALAAAGAWMADHNDGGVAIFLHPYRIDVSLNLFVLSLVLLLAVLWLAQKAISALWSLPREARRWRLQQKERAMHAALLDSLTQITFQRKLLLGPFRQFSSVELEIILALALGEIHGGIRVLEHGGRILAILGVHADADAASHLKAAIFDAQGFIDR